MSKDIFSGLEGLGFDNIEDINLYKKEKEEKVEATTVEQNPIDKEKSLLYEKEITCPVCENVFKAKAVKTSAYRIQKKDSDFFIRYSVINPYFYDVWVCNSCGYSAMKSDFNKVRSYQIDSIKKNITSKWTGRSYPETFDVNIAIERFKLALLNSYVMEAKSSKKAMNCLKLAWMYRLLNDVNNEKTFLKQSLEGFNDAYFNEDFPLYGMDKFTSMYLIGELNRRTDNYDEALKWFSQVVTTPAVPSKLKELARDQKDLINEELSANETKPTSDEEDKKPTGFFSKFFK